MNRSDLTTQQPLPSWLDAFRPASATEAADVERIRQLVARGDPWSRALPLHVTGSALIVHPESRRVLLRWHERMQGWLQVGGHADPDESDPYAIALREAREETGLQDLAPWPDPTHPGVIQVAVVPVPSGRGEPAHEHADIRYLLSSTTPDEATPESAAARLTWLSIEAAMASVGQDNLRICLNRTAQLLREPGAQ